MWIDFIHLPRHGQINSCYHQDMWFCEMSSAGPSEAKYLRGNRVGQVKRASGGRQTFTAGLVFGPTFKGYGVLVFSKLPQATEKMIKKDFGDILKVYTTKTGSVQSQFHVEKLIPGPIAASAQRLRNLCKVPADTLVLYEEDMAPSHIGDKDCHTKGDNLMKKRVDALREARLLRHLLPLNGTPNFSKNDQLHDLVKRDLLKRLQAISMRAMDWNQRPSQDLRAPGGICFTKKGYHRAPGKYLIAKAALSCKAFCFFFKVHSS